MAFKQWEGKDKIGTKKGKGNLGSSSIQRRRKGNDESRGQRIEKHEEGECEGRWEEKKIWHRGGTNQTPNNREMVSQKRPRQWEKGGQKSAVKEML